MSRDKDQIMCMILKEVYKIKMGRVHLMDCSAEEIILLAVNSLRMDIDRENKE